MALDPCLKQILSDIKKQLDEIAAKLGKEAKERAKAALVAAIDVIRSFLDAFLQVFEPLLLLDNIIFNNLIRPPLDLAVTIAEKTKETIRKPMNYLGMTKGGGDCPQIKGVGLARKAAEGLNKFDGAKYRNWLNRAEGWTKKNDDLIKNLRNSLKFLDELKAEVQAL